MRSRKFLLALGYAILAFVNSLFDLAIPPEAMEKALIAIVAFICAEGAADVVSRAKQKSTLK